MNRLFRLAVRLYPAWWRQRYAREFEALLEDVQPGWRDWFDIIRGALTMQMTTFGTIPVVCALAGAIVGGIVALQTPKVFASSATIGLKAADLASKESASAQELRVSLEKALGSSSGTKRATLVTVHRDESARTTLLKLTYLDRDPVEAQRVAERLTAAIATENSERAASFEVLAAPDLPASPIRPDYPVTVASGGGVGLVAGGVVFLLLRFRRRPTPDA
jgi:uncharacterized protein involved in exopolysaccharide biosynthesis